MTPPILILWLLCLYLFEFLVAGVFFQWLVAWTGNSAIAMAVIAAIAALTAVAVAVARLSVRLWGFVLAAAMILFWFFFIFEVSRETRIIASMVAGVLLVAGIAVAIADYLTMLRPPARGS
jgi:hypothetical protein